MKVYVLLCTNDEFSRCWDCGAGTDAINEQIIKMFINKNMAENKLKEYIEKEINKNICYWIDEYDVDTTN